MQKPSSRRRNSGQVLVITSLIIVMLLLSTFIYVAETVKNAPVYKAEANPGFSAYRLGTIHTVISALAAVSNGGLVSVLTENLLKYQWVVGNHTYDAILNATFSPQNTSPYEDGFWLSWGNSGTGVSSAEVNFVWNSSGTSTNFYSAYSVTISSDISIVGTYTLLTGTLKQANVTVNLFNEGKPALASNFEVYYEYNGNLNPEEWMPVSPSVTDYGNGTYLLSFTASTQNRNNPLLISIGCYDMRSIFVRANTALIKV